MTLNTTINLTAQQSTLLLDTLRKEFHRLANIYELMMDNNNKDKQLIANAFNAKKEVLQIIWKLEGELK